MPRYSEEDRQEMVRLYVEEGLGYQLVAKQFGCSHNTVAAAVRAAGVPSKPTGAQRRLKGLGTWGRRLMTNGYVGWSAWNPDTKQSDWVLEHRLIMSWMLGRQLLPGENVHHRDGNRANNDPSNLELWTIQHPAGMSHCPHCHERLTTGPLPPP